MSSNLPSTEVPSKQPTSSSTAPEQITQDTSIGDLLYIYQTTGKLPFTWKPLLMPSWMETISQAHTLVSMDKHHQPRIGFALPYSEPDNVYWAQNTALAGEKVFLGTLHYQPTSMFIWTWSYAMDTIEPTINEGVLGFPKRIGELTSAKGMHRATAQRIEQLISQPFFMLREENILSPALLGGMLLEAKYVYAVPSTLTDMLWVYAIKERWEDDKTNENIVDAKKTREKKDKKTKE
jgi:hypothetical protein